MYTYIPWYFSRRCLTHFEWCKDLWVRNWSLLYCSHFEDQQYFFKMTHWTVIYLSDPAQKATQSCGFSLIIRQSFTVNGGGVTNLIASFIPISFCLELKEFLFVFSCLHGECRQNSQFRLISIFISLRLFKCSV